MPISRTFRLVLILSAAGLCAAQTTESTHPLNSPIGTNQSSEPVFRANAREVVLDVTVLDASGNPVHGLPQSAFHITDNSHPQQARSFVEHAGNPAAPQTLRVNAGPSNRFSNEYLEHPPAAFNVILLDTTTIGTVDQMYLAWQMQKFLKTMPADQVLAVYARRGMTTLLLQNFTSDHALLLSAIRKVIPRLPDPNAQYTSDYGTLAQMATFLSQLPGRKNVLWFSGGSRLANLDDMDRMAAFEGVREIFDELERDRIAVYPIDVRGLTQSNPRSMTDQHFLMNEIAGATGGIAAYNNNWIWEIAQHVVDTSSSFYTLTYSPDDLKLDKKWHHVKVNVDGGNYRVYYREGYFDDTSGGPAKAFGHARTRLTAEGSSSAPDIHSEPIIFAMHIDPADQGGPIAPGTPAPPQPKKNERTYRIHYSLPFDSFERTESEGSTRVHVGAGVLAFNHEGRLVAKNLQQLNITFDSDRARAAKSFGADQFVNLPKGQGYLFVAVWDGVSGRLGTMEVPVDVTKAEKKH